MPEISDHHRYLFLGKITASLTPEEDRELQQLFASDSLAHRAYLDMAGKLPADDVAGAFGYLNSPGFWKDLPGELQRENLHRQRKKWITISGVAAAVALLILGASMMVSRQKTAPALVQTAHPQKPRAVELHLANGKTINLTSEKGTINAGDLSLNNSGNALSYQSNDDEPAGINSIVVPTGMDYKINLTDGSTIWLNSTTRLQFPSRFARDRREVTIDGEAYVQAARDASRPFLVNVPNGQVQVTGTEFNVNTYNTNDVRVALVEGGINFSDHHFVVHIQPGNQAVLSDGILSQESFDAKKVLSWQQGLFFFEKASLEELSQVLQRWYGIGTTLDNPSLRDKHFAGILDKNKPVDNFLDNLKVISRIDSYFDKEGILHFR